jgi:hypothetical protein
MRTDPEKTKAYHAAYRSRNREKQRAWARAYTIAHPEKIAASKRMQHYDLAEDQYQTMLLLQQGKCAICGEVMNPPVVEHDHITNKVRGLTCNNCNTGLGMFKDNPEYLRSAIHYLEAH